MLKISAGICERLGSQFFRTTIEIQSLPDVFDESRFVMTFLTIMRVTEILCSCRLVLEGKAGKESSRLNSQKVFLANSFALSDVERNTSGPLNRGGIVDLLLLRTLLAISQNSQEPSFWEVILFCFSSICKFGNFKSPFAMITSLSELQIQKIYSVDTNGKSDFYELWQQHMQLENHGDE